MKRDNVVTEGARTFSDLGLAPRAMSQIAPGYLS